MIIVNRPGQLIDATCYKCKSILKLHPAQNMNSEYVTNCELHKAEQESQVRYWIINDEGERVSVEEQCKHESNGKFYGAMEWGAPGKLKCKKCGEIYE